MSNIKAFIYSLIQPYISCNWNLTTIPTMTCPFCAIATGSPSSPDPPIVSGPGASAYIVLSTSTVVAFLDIAPLTRGHVLLCPREHRAKITDLTLQESAATGFWIPVLSKAVMKGVGLEIESGSWNIVQANGRLGFGQNYISYFLRLV
jgi:diadenosine tetraphosphate (Ap4A) HIT family hydrolase